MRLIAPWLAAALITLLLTGRSFAAPPPAGFAARHYDVAVTPDFEKGALVGASTITVVSRQAGLREVAFSPNNMTIDKVSVSGEAASAVRQPGGWVIMLPRALGNGATARIEIDYHGMPTRGVTFGPRSVYTSYFACDWMFCNQDRPGEKATLTLSLIVPRGFATLGTGRLVSSGSLPSGLQVQRWREDRPYSSYLYGFAAGVFAEATMHEDGDTFRYLGHADDASKLRTLFAATPSMLRFLESKAGAPLPHHAYAQLLVPGDDAQEGVSFSIIGADEITPSLTDPRDDWVVVHELAHQWWGNLITCESWDEFWLNEGVTTFMVAAWKEHRWGRAAYDAEMEIARKRVAAAAAVGFDKPLTFGGKYPSLAIRRDIQYFKGELFMDELRRTLGDAAFWQGLRDYTRSHIGGVVNSHDFQRAMEAASGRDLSELFDRWVYDRTDVTG